MLLFLGIACFEIIQGAVTRIWEGVTPINVAGAELWILSIVLAVNIFVAYYERSVGNRIGSPIPIADSQHTTSDIWVTVTVLVGLIGIWLGRMWSIPQLQLLDVILSFPVSFLVFSSGWRVLRENLPWLVDEMAIAQTSHLSDCHRCTWGS